MEMEMNASFVGLFVYTHLTMVAFSSSSFGTLARFFLNPFYYLLSIHQITSKINIQRWRLSQGLANHHVGVTGSSAATTIFRHSWHCRQWIGLWRNVCHIWQRADWFGVDWTSASGHVTTGEWNHGSSRCQGAIVSKLPYLVFVVVVVVVESATK